MAEPTIQLGGGNWAGKSGNLLGYYEQNKKFYAEDFTFSRSTTGTYTDSDGYIQEMPYNLATYSESFGGSTFFNSTQNLTVINNNAVAPNGTTTAAKLTSTANGARLGTANLVPSILSPSTTYTFSVYIKNINAANYYVRTVSATPGDNVEYTISTTEWTRIEHTFTTGASATYIRLVSDLAEGESILAWGAQVVKGSSAKTYFPTTTRLNMPRVDYLNNSNGSLILEPQRTNVIDYSNNYTQWSNTQFTINSNSVTSPEGITSGTKIVPSTSNTEKYLDKGGFSRTSGQYITHTVYAKASGYNFLYLSNSASRLYAVYDLQQGLVIYNNSNGTDFNNHSASIELFGNGWYRCKLIGQAQSTFASYFRISCGTTAINSSTQGLFQGDGISGIEVYGSQVELNESYATSYIPTSGSSVTRNEDACSITNVADRINSSEGVLYAEIAALADDLTNRIISLSEDGNNNNRVTISYTSGSNKIKFVVRLNGANEFDETVTLSNILDYNKVALKFAENNFAVYINGVKEEEQLSGSTYSANTLDKLSFDKGNGTFDFYGKTKQLQVYNTALTDSELATLTT
jgi:hypothetical protein